MEHLFHCRCCARYIARISYKPPVKKKKDYPYLTNEEEEAQSLNNLPVVIQLSNLKPTLCPLMHFFPFPLFLSTHVVIKLQNNKVYWKALSAFSVIRVSTVKWGVTVGDNVSKDRLRPD